MSVSAPPKLPAVQDPPDVEALEALIEEARRGRGGGGSEMQPLASSSFSSG
jgi:hypothetical protein